MSACGCNFEALPSCDCRQFAPELNNLLSRISRIVTNLSAQFHDRLVHLGLDVLFQNDFAAGKNLLDMRTEFACLRIDDLKFLLNSESEDMIAETRLLPRHTRLSSWFLSASRAI